jgi:hypothetical protein
MRYRIPCGKGISISLSKPFPFFLLLDIDSEYEELAATALDIRSKTSSWNTFSHSSWMLVSLSAIWRGTECSHSVITVSDENVLKAYISLK